MRKIIGKKNKVHYVEETTRLKMVKSHKGWLVIGTSMFALGLGVLVTSQPVSADVVATSTSSSAVRAETTSASDTKSAAQLAAIADSVTPAANIDWNNWQKNAQFSLSNNWYSSDSAFTKNSDGTYSVDFKNQPQFSVVSQGDTIGTIGMTRIAVAIIDAADGTSSINNLTSDVTVSDKYGHSYTASGTLVAGQNPYHFKDENGSWHTVKRHIVYISIPNSELTNFTYSNIGAAQFNISFSANMNSIPNYPTNWIRYGSKSDTTPTLNGDGSPATANQTATEISTNTVNNLPQVTKVYYKDAATGNEIASSEILGKGGTSNTPVNAKMKDLTSLSYTFVKGEYLNNTGTDNYFTDNSYDTTLNNTKQAVVFWYSRNQGTTDVTYIDDTTGKTLSSKDLSGNTGSVSDYVTSDTISDYKNQGYSLVSDNYPSSGMTFTDEHQHYEVHLKHNVTKETEKKTVNETIHYVYKDGSKAFDDYVAKPVEFSRTVSTDAVTGEKTYGNWSADQSFDAVTSPDLKGYTADKAQIDKQTVNGDSKDLEFTVTYRSNDKPVITAPNQDYKVGDSIDPLKNVTTSDKEDGTTKVTVAKIVDQDGKVIDSIPNDKAGKYTVTYTTTDADGNTVTKDATISVRSNEKPGNGTDNGNPSSNQPGNPSQPSNATNNGVINTSTNIGSKVNNGAVNSPELPQTGENNRQSQTMSFIGVLLAMFGSLLGFLGIKKRRND